MKFKTGDKIIYYKREIDRPNHMLSLFDTYIVEDILYHKSENLEYFNKQNFFLSLLDKYNTKSFWYDCRDFMTMKEYRKFKLNRIKNASS